MYQSEGPSHLRSLHHCKDPGTQALSESMDHGGRLGIWIDWQRSAGPDASSCSAAQGPYGIRVDGSDDAFQGDSAASVVERKLEENHHRL